MPIKIKMRSSADLVKGQGVGSCFEEQVRLVKEGLPKDYSIEVNKRGYCDILHFHTVNLGYYFEMLLKKRTTKSIGYVHFLPDTLDDSLDLPKICRIVFYKYLLNFYNSMDYLVTVNPSIIKKLEEYNINKPKIFYIPNYVSEEDFYVQDEDKILSTRKKYNIPEDKFVVMCGGQLQTRKGIFDFVEVAKKMPHIQFIWVGGFSFGKITDGYEGIKKILDNPPSNINFLGIVDREEMVDFYNMSDLFFLPSFDELFPMTILEALCCKMPILLRDVDIYEDILFDSYLKASDVDGFVNIIQSLADNKDMLEHWQEKSWECHNFYNKSSILNMWERLYKEAYEELTSSLLNRRRVEHEKLL